MGKALVFYHPDWKRGQHTLTLRQVYDMPVFDQLRLFHTSQYCTNSETYLMTDALLKCFDAVPVANTDFERMRAEKADCIIVNGLHCLSCTSGIDVNFWQKILDLGIKVVPMPFGFWYKGNTERVTPEMLYIVKQIAERSEIGVRGEFAAQLLNDAGIKNVRVIGDVSMMHPMNRHFTVRTDRKCVEKLNCDFTNYYPYQFHEQDYFLRYVFPIFNYYVKLYKQKRIQVDYTMVQSLMEELINHLDLQPFEDVKAFLLERGRYFFRVDEWIQAVAENDFTLCTRFHGGIASILARTPALEVALDMRTIELCRAHKIPYITPEQFDADKPIEYYYELADYTEFNRYYPTWYDNFLAYCKQGDVPLRAGGEV